MNRPCHRALAAALLSALPTSAFAAGTDPATAFALNLTAITTIVIIAVLFLILIMPDEDRRKAGAALSSFRGYFIRGRQERAPAFDHEYDGIRELDNRIPPWFSTLFLGTIVFAAIYMLNYHVFGTSKLMAEEYRDEIAEADLQRRITIAREGAIDESALAAITDGAALTRAAGEYGKYCVSCHGSQGQGLVGPNLTDDYWIHGGGITNVYAVIKNGVPAKGMISWQLVFTPKQIQELASYVLSLHGTNPPNAKKPEGDLYVAKDTTSVAPGGTVAQ